jgi:hypothetical protein
LIFISLLLTLTPPQTTSTPMSVRAQVSQTCAVTATRVTCRGALDRPGHVRITRGVQNRAKETLIAHTLERVGRTRIAYTGPVSVIEF